MSSSPILAEIHSEQSIVPPRECVCCGKEQSVIDIATQAVQEPSAGMHSCQTCLPIDMSWYGLDWLDT